MIRKMLTVAIAVGSLAIAACNTVEGAGEDLQSASEEVKEEINN